MKLGQLTERIIGLAIKVHRKLGPGLLESVYQAALAYEMNKAGIFFEKEKAMPVPYDDIMLDVGFRCDFIVERGVIVECKSVRNLTDMDTAQLLNYLKLSKLQLGLLINFNVLVLKDGLKRIANNYNENE